MLFSPSRGGFRVKELLLAEQGQRRADHPGVVEAAIAPFGCQRARAAIAVARQLQVTLADPVGQPWLQAVVEIRAGPVQLAVADQRARGDLVAGVDVAAGGERTRIRQVERHQPAGAHRFQRDFVADRLAEILGLRRQLVIALLEFPAAAVKHVEYRPTPVTLPHRRRRPVELDAERWLIGQDQIGDVARRH
jgi:hypothetical protein